MILLEAYDLEITSPDLNQVSIVYVQDITHSQLKFLSTILVFGFLAVSHNIFRAFNFITFLNSENSHLHSELMYSLDTEVH